MCRAAKEGIISASQNRHRGARDRHSTRVALSLYFIEDVGSTSGEWALAWATHISIVAPRQ